jgi:hypothetical protein
LLLVACSVQDNTADVLKIVPREEWGSVSQMHDTPEHTISKITIHHGGVIYTGDKPADEYLRDLQSWSRSKKKWIDIPYHYLMDLEGIVYEGRAAQYPGDTNTDYDPTGHLLICIIGNYEEQEFNQKQFNNLILFLTDFSKQYDVSIDSIKSHKDYTETACPGQNIYKFLEDGSLIKAVQKKIALDLNKQQTRRY